MQREIMVFPGGIFSKSTILRIRRRILAAPFAIPVVSRGGGVFREAILSKSSPYSFRSGCASRSSTRWSQSASLSLAFDSAQNRETD